MIVWQPHDFKLRHVAITHMALEFVDPYIRSLLVGGRQVERRIVRIDIGRQFALRHRPTWVSLNHFSVVAKTYAVLKRECPQKSPFWFLCFFTIDISALAGISRWDRLLAIIGNIRSCRPDVSLRTHFGVHKEAIE